MKLKQALLQCDPNSASDLEQLYLDYRDQESLFHQLLEFLADEQLQQVASWLIKKYLEQSDVKACASQSSLLIQYLSVKTFWQVRLHILQSLPYCIFSPQDKNVLAFYLRENLADENKFIRSWAYNGFHCLSIQFTEYKAEVAQFFQLALQDEAPSVKARIRQILKKTKSY